MDKDKIMVSFMRFIILCISVITFGYAQSNPSSKQEEEDVKKKLLFKGKESYEKHLQKRNEEHENAPKPPKENKIYKKSDDSIDTFKTFNSTKE